MFLLSGGTVFYIRFRRSLHMLQTYHLLSIPRTAEVSKGLHMVSGGHQVIGVPFPLGGSRPRVSMYVGDLDDIHDSARVRFTDIFGDEYSAVLALAEDGIIHATAVTVDDQEEEIYPERVVEYSPEDGCFYDTYAGKILCPLEREHYTADDIVSCALEECVDGITDVCSPGLHISQFVTGFCPADNGNDRASIVDHIVSCMEPLVRDGAVALLSRCLDDDPYCRRVDSIVSSDGITYICEVPDVEVEDGERKDITHILEITLRH